jgi:hypothetical protein
MPLYRVTLARIESLEKTSRNPFCLGIDVLKPVRCRVTTRVWEFEARSERAVRRFFKQAVDQRLPNVVGYNIQSIELADAPAQSSSEKP